MSNGYALGEREERLEVLGTDGQKCPEERDDKRRQPNAQALSPFWSRKSTTERKLIPRKFDMTDTRAQRDGSGLAAA